MTSHMKIPPVKISFSANDRREILSRIDHCLETGFIAQDENVDEFEQLFRQYIGCQHALALSSGGSAIEAAMRGLDVRGKEVLVPTDTFLATAAGVLAVDNLGLAVPIPFFRPKSSPVAKAGCL